MTLYSDGPVKQLTDIHRKVSRRIERLGIRVMDEVSFPPYTVDIWVVDAHFAVEVDGPQHLAKKDKKRDQVLLEKYNLPVLHIPMGEAKKASHIKKIVLQAYTEYIEDAMERFREVEDRIIWL